MAVTDDAGAPQRRRQGPVDPRLVKYATASRSFFLISAAIVLAQTGVILGFAWMLTITLVGAINGAPVAELLPPLGLAALLVLVRALLIAASERVSARGAALASLQLRRQLVAAIDKLGPGWLSSRNAASIAVTAGHGLEALDAYFGRYLPQLVATAITMPILMLAIFLADPISGITVAVTMPLIPLFMVLIGLATRAKQRRQFKTLSTLAARFADTVNGLGTLKIFGRDHRAADRIETVTRDYKRETMSVLRVSFLSGFALEFLASLSVALIAVTIGLRMLAGDMTLIVGLFVLLLAPEAYLPIRQVGLQFHAAAEGVAATDDIFEVLDAASAGPSSRLRLALSEQSETKWLAQGPAGEHTPTVAERDEARGALLRVDNLRVHRGAHTLPEVSFRVTAGEVVLIEGPSGAGKSSILAALLGFADHDGHVSAQRGNTPDDRRAEIAWAGQHPGLISGTVLQNVALGAATPAAELAAVCLHRASASEIDLDLHLGATGSGLSGGEAQRVALARALYRLESTPARLLILDEPTSALDAVTESNVWRTVRDVADSGAGVLIVSHRVSAREIADRVVRVERAEVTA